MSSTDLRVGAAQFEARDNDKTYNLSRVRDLIRAFTLIMPGVSLSAAHAPQVPEAAEIVRLAGT
jgi:hypothetical protein